MRTLLPALFAALILASGAEAHPPVRYIAAHTYLYGWNLRLRASLSLEDVRQQSSVKTTIKSPAMATEFAESLGLDSLVPNNREAGVGDPRFVIDLVRQDGSRETFYARDSHLFSEDGTRLRKIDTHFQRRFALLPPGPTSTNRKAMQYKSATVYLVGWNIQTRTRLSMEDVRRRSSVTTTIGSGEVSEFAKSLQLDTLAPRVEAVVDEPRLVIDLVRFDGKRETFYANDAYLFSDDGSRMREVDVCFQRRFELLPPGDCE